MSSHDGTSEHGQGPMSALGNSGRPSPQIQHVPRREGDELNDLIERLEDRRRIMWNAPLKDGGYAKLVSPEDLSAAIRGLYRLEVLEATLPQPGGWRPIETAPKDFTPIIGITPRGIRQWFRWVNDRHCGTGWYNSEQGGVDLTQQPTLWQPLPPVPTDGGKQDGSASSNSATRLASQVCDTDAPSDLERELLAALQEIRDGMVASRDDISVEDWIEIADTAIQKAR